MDDFCLPNDEQISAMQAEYEAIATAPKERNPELLFLASMQEEQVRLLGLLVVKCRDKLLIDMLNQIMEQKEITAIQLKKEGGKTNMSKEHSTIKTATTRFLFREFFKLQTEIILQITKLKKWELATQELAFLELMRFIRDY